MALLGVFANVGTSLTDFFSEGTDLHELITTGCFFGAFLYVSCITFHTFSFTLCVYLHVTHYSLLFDLFFHLLKVSGPSGSPDSGGPVFCHFSMFSLMTLLTSLTGFDREYNKHVRHIQ